jgi:hypothetical protein
MTGSLSGYISPGFSLWPHAVPQTGKAIHITRNRYTSEGFVSDGTVEEHFDRKINGGVESVYLVNLIGCCMENKDARRVRFNRHTRRKN